MAIGCSGRSFSRSALDAKGFAVIEPAVPEAAADLLIAVLERWHAHAEGSSGANLRNLAAAVPEVGQLCAESSLRELASEALGRKAFVVRSLLFDKTAAANWKVAWHQDLTIAVKERHETAGFGPWSVKSGVVHVQPPPSLLERMITLRLHLDNCHARNGPLRVLPGTHRLGRLDGPRIEALKEAEPAITCLVKKCGVLALRPLLLHASSPAERPGHRRVIHFEFAGEDLPGELEWFERR